MVRACGSYPQCPGFESLRRYYEKVVVIIVLPRLFFYNALVVPGTLAAKGC